MRRRVTRVIRAEHSGHRGVQDVVGTLDDARDTRRRGDDTATWGVTVPGHRNPDRDTKERGDEQDTRRQPADGDSGRVRNYGWLVGVSVFTVLLARTRAQ